MKYYLKRKNNIITVVNMDEKGIITDFAQNIQNPELAPLHDSNDKSWIRNWWDKRSIPVSQTGIKRLLEQKGYTTNTEYSCKNLGLSLTDYYWMCPVDAGLTWEDVNLFDNDFSDNILLSETHNETDENSGIPHYTPNSTLQGNLEKSWVIMEGKRCLLKGNKGNLSCESINEVIASELHRLQGFENHTPYELISIGGRQYDYGCISELFTNQSKELISAYAIEISEKKKNDINTFEHFINVCEKYGMDSEVLRQHLDYQIMTDFILSDRDRHLSNISVLRDAGTLKIMQMAPIYDSGKCLFVEQSVPSNIKDLLDIHTESFASTELKLLEYVTDRTLVDINKLPSPGYICKMYSMDSQMDEKRTKRIADAYEQKINLFDKWQHGENLSVRKVYMQGEKTELITKVNTPKADKG